jgi:hypothetical protein
MPENGGNSNVKFISYYLINLRADDDGICLLFGHSSSTAFFTDKLLLSAKYGCVLEAFCEDLIELIAEVGVQEAIEERVHANGED